MKYSGMIGFVSTEETRPGIYETVAEERHYVGDLTRSIDKWQAADNQSNDNITVNNQVSIVANRYIYDHLHQIRYLTLHGIKWKVNSITENYPRLILEIGGVYNESESSD